LVVCMFRMQETDDWLLALSAEPVSTRAKGLRSLWFCSLNTPRVYCLHQPKESCAEHAANQTKNFRICRGWPP
jgi:hypothetical protein